MWSLRWIEHLRQDVGYGVRRLRRDPRFTAAAVLTLALGTGATTAIFTVASAVLFRDLPYHEPDRLVQFWNNFRQHQMENVVFSHLEYLDYRARIRGIEALAVYGHNTQTLKTKGEPEQVWVSSVSSNLFDLLGVRPLHGRTFAAEESETGGAVILSHALWQRRFGGDPAVLGSSISLQGEPHVVVGVMPATFRSPAVVAELWRPIVFSGEMVQETQRGSRSLWMIGRLKRGTSLDAARREMAAHAEQIATERREQYPAQLGHAVTVVPLHDQITGGVRRALFVLLVAVGMVMLIACANVANLLLTRATARHTEMAVRAALGASRVRVLSQMLTESLGLAILGGAAGTLLAVWSVDLLLQLTPSGVLPRMNEVGVSMPVLSFSLALSLVTGVLFGLAPALQASSSALCETLKDGARTDVAGRGKAIGGLLTVSEVALALVLLVGAGLLIRSFARLVSVPAGFDTDNVFTMRVALPTSTYSNSAVQLAFFEQLGERTRALPGVDAVGLVTSLPFSGWRNDWSISLEGVPGMDGSGGGSLPAANYFAVNTDYFRSPADREIGLRMALGAQHRDVFRMVIRQGMWLAAAGVAVGLAGALWLARFLESLLFDVQPSDPLTLGSVAVALMAVALCACWLPARQAARLDPMVALRRQ